LFIPIVVIGTVLSCLTTVLKLRKLGGNGPHNVAQQFNQAFPRENGFTRFSPSRDEFHESLIF
jgi:hypothetical protein